MTAHPGDSLGSALARLRPFRYGLRCTGQPVTQLAGQPMGEPQSRVALNMLASRLDKAPASVHCNALNGPVVARVSLPAEGRMEATVPKVGLGVDTWFLTPAKPA